MLGQPEMDADYRDLCVPDSRITELDPHVEVPLVTELPRH